MQRPRFQTRRRAFFIRRSPSRPAATGVDGSYAHCVICSWEQSMFALHASSVDALILVVQMLGPKASGVIGMCYTIPLPQQLDGRGLSFGLYL